MSENLLFIRGLSLERLQTLMELERAGSLAKAAPGNATRQTLYSRQLKQLGEYFGVELVRRQGRELGLTRDGLELANIARENFTALSDFARKTRAQPLVMNVGGIESLIHWSLLPCLGRLTEQLPPMQVRISSMITGDLVRGLQELKLDLALLREAGLPAGLARNRLFSLTFSLFVPRKLMLGKKTIHAEQALVDLPLALSQGVSFRRDLERACLQRKLNVNPQLETLTATQACRAVLSEKYAAILPSIAAVDLDPARFVELPLPWLKALDRNICLAWNPRVMQLRPGLQKVSEAFKRMLCH